MPILLIPTVLAAAPNFKAEKATDHGIDVVRLTDVKHDVEVSIAPTLGNRAYELKVHGKNLLNLTSDIATLFQNKGAGPNGIPFLAPWGNRIPGGGFWANGKRYTFNQSLNNVHMLPHEVAIHGMLTASPRWEVIEVVADKTSARVTSKLQFWRYPDLMANWPFAHEYLMTYKLTENGLEVSTTINNLSSEPMPVVIGFHPYFNIPDVPRPEWSIHIPARKHVEMDSDFVATGEMTENKFGTDVSLRDHTFDDGFTDLVRDARGFATFSAQTGNKKIEVVYGPNYKVALVFAPPKQNFVCFEPMVGITNAANLAHDGKYSELQSVPANGTWHESFWIRYSGF